METLFTLIDRVTRFADSEIKILRRTSKRFRSIFPYYRGAYRVACPGRYPLLGGTVSLYDLNNFVRYPDGAQIDLPNARQIVVDRRPMRIYQVNAPKASSMKVNSVYKVDNFMWMFPRHRELLLESLSMKIDRSVGFGLCLDVRERLQGIVPPERIEIAAGWVDNLSLGRGYIHSTLVTSVAPDTLTISIKGSINLIFMGRCLSVDCYQSYTMRNGYMKSRKVTNELVGLLTCCESIHLSLKSFCEALIHIEPKRLFFLSLYDIEEYEKEVSLQAYPNLETLIWKSHKRLPTGLSNLRRLRTASGHNLESLKLDVVILDDLQEETVVGDVKTLYCISPDSSMNSPSLRIRGHIEKLFIKSVNQMILEGSVDEIHVVYPTDMAGVIQHNTLEYYKRKPAL